MDWNRYLDRSIRPVTDFFSGAYPNAAARAEQGDYAGAAGAALRAPFNALYQRAQDPIPAMRDSISRFMGGITGAPTPRTYDPGPNPALAGIGNAAREGMSVNFPKPAPQQPIFDPIRGLRAMAMANMPFQNPRQPTYQEQFTGTVGELLKGQLAQAYQAKDAKAINEVIDKMMNFAKARGAVDYRMGNVIGHPDE